MTTHELRCSRLQLLTLGAALIGGCGGKASGPSEIHHIDGGGDGSGIGGDGGTPGLGGTQGIGGTVGIGGSSSLRCEVGRFVSTLPPPSLGQVCEPCPDATWDHDANAETECVSWSQCVPGQHIESAGSTTLDRVCAACPEGSFSSEPNTFECLPWSSCSDGFVQTAAGTPTSDRVCKEEPWIGQFGTMDVDYVEAIGTDTAGNVFVAGSTYGTFPANESKGGIDDAFVRKFDAMGNELWTRQFGTSERDGASGLAVDTDGNVIVGGFTNGVLVPGAQAGDGDAFVRKYDALGQELWTKQFGTEKNDGVSGVAIGENDEVVVVGITVGSLVSQIGSVDAFARKYDSWGNELWTGQFGSAGSDITHGVSVDDDGNVLIVGSTLGELPGHVNEGQQDVFVCKYDGAGTELWTRQFGTAGNEYGTGVATDAAGNVIVTGDTPKTLPGQVTAGTRDAFARKYDASGAELWTRQFGTNGLDYAAAVAVDDDGDVIVVGSTSGALPGQSVDGGGEYGTFVRKYDGAGGELWTQQFGSSSDNYAAAVCTDTFGHIFVAGDTVGTFAQQTSSGSFDGFVIRLSE